MGCPVGSTLVFALSAPGARCTGWKTEFCARTNVPYRRLSLLKSRRHDLARRDVLCKFYRYFTTRLAATERRVYGLQLYQPSANGVTAALCRGRGSSAPLLRCEVHLRLATAARLLFQYGHRVLGFTKVEPNVRVHLTHLEAELVAQCRVLSAAQGGAVIWGGETDDANVASHTSFTRAYIT